MRRPSFIDFLIGNFLFMFGLAVGLVYVWSEYQRGQQDNIVLLVIGGYFLLWSRAARSRVIAWRNHQREWQKMEQGVSGARELRPQGTLPSVMRRLALMMAAILAVMFLPFIVTIVWQFLTGFMPHVGYRMPPISTVFPKGFFSYPFDLLYGADALVQWGEAHRQAIFPVVAEVPLALLAVYLARRVLRRLPRRRSGRAAGWDGTVQVMLPIPKERGR